MRHTCRRWNVNLQTATIVIDGKKQRVRVSAAGLRTLRKNAKVTNTAKKVEAPAETAPAAEEAK